jgi:hypothetical protein
MYCEAQGIDHQLPKYHWGSLEDTGKDCWHHVAGAVTKAASERQTVNIDYIDVAPTELKIFTQHQEGKEIGQCLSLKAPVAASQRHHKTPGATGSIVQRITNSLAKGGMMLRLSTISAAEVISESERIDHETGEVRELLDNEGTW